jgi:hypothetical protein
MLIENGQIPGKKDEFLIYIFVLVYLIYTLNFYVAWISSITKSVPRFIKHYLSIVYLRFSAKDGGNTGSKPGNLNIEDTII